MSGTWGRPGQPTAKQREAWAAFEASGWNQLKAARDFGLSQGALRQHLIGYMKHMGIEGPLPTFAKTRPGKIINQVRYDLQQQRIRADAAEAEVARLRERVRTLEVLLHIRHADGGPRVGRRERKRMLRTPTTQYEFPIP